jgi:GxxExxY protein
MEYRHAGLTGEIIGAALEVHKELGGGFQELIYQRALAIEFSIRRIDYAEEKETPVYYKTSNIGSRRVDFLISGMICVELKALIKLEEVHLAQALNYLEAFNLEVGLLINFGGKSLEVKRLYNTKYNDTAKDYQKK